MAKITITESDELLRQKVVRTGIIAEVSLLDSYGCVSFRLDALDPHPSTLTVLTHASDEDMKKLRRLGSKLYHRVRVETVTVITLLDELQPGADPG